MPGLEGVSIASNLESVCSNSPAVALSLRVHGCGCFAISDPATDTYKFLTFGLSMQSDTAVQKALLPHSCHSAKAGWSFRMCYGPIFNKMNTKEP